MNSQELNERIVQCRATGGIRLYLRGLGVSEIPEEAFEFRDLQHINLDRNRFTDLPESVFFFSKLLTLSITDNHVSEIPSSISQLDQLRELIASGNLISKVGAGIGGLSKLEVLHLSNNRITSLPESIADLERLTVCTLSGNPHKFPYAIQDDIEQLKNYLLELKHSSEFSIHEAKLIVVGDGDVGKTRLVGSLLNKEVTEESTHGIDVSTWVVNQNDKKEVERLNIWDFGGQEIYYSTHQYFLTKQAVYLFVWNARADDDIHSFDYWLNIITLLSGNSPIYCVQNKIDVRQKEIDRVGLRNYFSGIRDFFNTSATEGKGIKELKARILQEARKLPHYNQTVPLAWIRIREHLVSIKKPYISYSEYISICEEYKLDIKRAEHLSGNRSDSTLKKHRITRQI